MFQPGSATLPPVKYVRRVWYLRHFVFGYARARHIASRADMALGRLWNVLEPALTIATYYLVFDVMLGRSSESGSFVLFLAIGQLFYANARRMITRSATSLARNDKMARSFVFPHLVYLAADAVDVAISFFYSTVVLLLLIVVLGDPPSWAWMFLPLIVVSQFLYSFGIGLLLSRPFVRYPDLTIILDNVFRALLFLSGVFWSVDQFATGDHRELILKILSLNPIYDSIALARWVLLDQQPVLLGWVLTSMIVWMVVAPIAGFHFFYRKEQFDSGSSRVKQP